MNRDTLRRLKHATGYTELGMLAAASDELEQIAPGDRSLPEVLSVRVAYHMEAKHWKTVVDLGSQLAGQQPQEFQGWMAWAFALHELKRTAEARAVLLDAEPHHGAKVALLHYNLACYECVLGDLDAARSRLRQACKMDKTYKATALEDPDLKALRRIDSVES